MLNYYFVLAVTCATPDPQFIGECSAFVFPQWFSELAECQQFTTIELPLLVRQAELPSLETAVCLEYGISPLEGEEA